MLQNKNYQQQQQQKLMLQNKNYQQQQQQKHPTIKKQEPQTTS